jgi:peptide chain release factor 1
MFAIEDFLEAANGFGDRNVFAFRAGKDLSNVERLAEETLDLAGAQNRQFVFRAELVHAENRDDVLEIAVALQHLLHSAGYGIMLFADHVRRE